MLILHADDKPITTDDIDSIVSAELPDPQQFPDLHRIIVNCMLHGPCGSANPKASCMENGHCSKGYPKQYCSDTFIRPDAYVNYQRRSDGSYAIKNGHRFTNRDVVPFNAYLSAKYDCHINVEIVTTKMVVKYLYKYVYKGHDRATVTVQNEQTDQDIDEISTYLHSQYVSPSEACWRIFGFSMHDNYPKVTRLAVHLENMDYIRFDPNNVSQHDLPRDTTLTACFAACRNPQYAHLTHDLLYPDFPSRFTWNSSTLTWTPRKTGDCIGRVYFVYPSEGERYYLRLLLYNVPCPTSFQFLRTYRGIVYETFQAACMIRGLLETDDQWDKCLQEAASIQSGHQLRQLFAIILLNNSITDPAALYRRHAIDLADDCRYRLCRQYQIPNPSNDQIQNLCLQLIDLLLQQAGKSLASFHLPLPSTPLK